MISRDTSGKRTLAALGMALALAACWFGAAPALAQENGLRLNDREYFETRGLNVLVLTNRHRDHPARRANALLWRRSILDRPKPVGWPARGR